MAHSSLLMDIGKKPGGSLSTSYEQWATSFKSDFKIGLMVPLRVISLGIKWKQFKSITIFI